MECKGKKQTGHFFYLGIEENLKGIISPLTFPKRVIKLLINIDGLQLFNRSGQQMWPILMMIHDPDFETVPFLVGAFCGRSKPLFVKKFLIKFVQELIRLLKKGFYIDGVHFTIEIIGFICDTPARSFIKCCKGHGGFYSCERCEVRGLSVKNSKGNKKRIYTCLNSKLRTKTSFKKNQKQHHKGTSPLLKIPRLDLVRQVFLDPMHLLYLGLQKLVMNKWIFEKKLYCTINVSQKIHLQKLLENLTNVPDEFQRKIFDLNDFANWKATQFRFFLHYATPVFLRKILKENVYQHYLLFFVACRVLCDPELAVERADYS